MLLNIYKENLLKLFKLASFVTILEKKSAISTMVGSNVLLEVQPEFIKMIATDLDVELVVTEPRSPEDISIPGKVVLPFRKISEICRAVTANMQLKVTAIEGSNLKLKIEIGQSFFILNYLPATNFPVITSKEFTQSLKLQVGLFQEILSKVTFAMGDQESRHFLNGIHLHFSAGTISSVAADGHRLMIFEASPSADANFLEASQEISIIIPRKSVFDILKIMADYPKESLVNIDLDHNYIRLSFKNINYTSKLLSAVFPPYKRLIPVTSNTLTIEREDLKNACLRVGALFGDKSQAVKLKFTRDKLIITGVNEQGDLAEENLPAKLEGKELEIAFNLKYLLDFGCNSTATKIIFKFENATTGVIIQDVELVNSYILMPMQL